MNISFGKKIPIASCSVINRITKLPQSAIIFEHDCKDVSDYEFFKNLSDSWEYKDEVAKQALNKFRMPLSNLGTKIYSLSTQNGRTIGIMETSEYSKFCDVQHLESQLKGLYGYTGSTLLSFLAQEKLRQNVSSIFVSNPAKSARTFYKDHCFFKNSPPIGLELDKKGMKNLIEKTQRKAQSQIMDLRG